MPTTTLLRRVRLVALLGSLGLAAALPATTAAQGTPSAPALPGPPPGAGSNLPSPPTAGKPPVQGPEPGAVTLQSGKGGPSLLNGSARLSDRSRRFTLSVFCKANGRVTVTSPDVANGGFAKGSYRCRGGESKVSLQVSRTSARRLARLSSVIAQATLRQGGTSTRNSLTLQAGPQRPDDEFWSDGRLQCSPLGTTQPQSYAIAPNFTANPSITISFRPWVAWYSPRAGWHWRGVTGEKSSQWYNWTATLTGIAEWQLPGGGISPWSWGPISVPAGAGTYAVAAFEIVYWSGGRPSYTWKYVKSGTEQPTGSYCFYP